MFRKFWQKIQFAGIPFYIFISLLVGGLGFGGVKKFMEAQSGLFAIICGLLFLLHISLYWLNLKFFSRQSWHFFYYPSQIGLIMACALLPYPEMQGEAAYGITVVSFANICLIGSVLGLWGNTQKTLMIGLLVLGALLAGLFLTVNPAELIPVTLGVLTNTAFVVLFMLALNQQLSERQKAQELAESLESANAKLAAYTLKNEALARQNERQRVARELHDTLAQGLAGLVLQLEAARTHLQEGHPERTSSILEQAIGRARSTLTASRAAIDGLRTQPPTSLGTAIQEKLAQFEQETGLVCHTNLNVSGNIIFSPQASGHILSVLGETLTNVARHAQASQVAVRANVENGQFILEIQDNGLGFDPFQPPVSGHYGLQGMKERANLCGGTLTIVSAPGQGTTIRLAVPTSNRETL